MLKKIIKYILSFFRKEEMVASVPLENYRVIMDDALGKKLLEMGPRVRIENRVINAFNSIGSVMKSIENNSKVFYRADMWLDGAIVLTVLSSKGMIYFIKIDIERYCLMISGVYVLGKQKVLDLNNVLSDENPSNVVSIRNNRYLDVEVRHITFTVVTRTVEIINTYRKRLKDEYRTADYEISTEINQIGILDGELIVVGCDKQEEIISKPLNGSEAFDCYLK